ncbi:hypothetical protein AALK14_01040 [Butyricimonas hominis]|uniref:hypothetical protein n=1 Tax=Butyricimonas TaxID=574697 RepID=UPI0026DDB138|nr:hypothetical protein [uncultured Butyricimonas sp.]
MKKPLLLGISLPVIFFLGCQESLLEEPFMDIEGEEIAALHEADGRIARIIASGSSLNDGQRFLLLQSLYYLEARYPELEKVIEYIMGMRGPIMFKMDSSIVGDASYDSYTISFKYEYCIEPERLLEEILHAAQDILYGYSAMQKARKNVEFEVRVFRDILEYRACEQNHEMYKFRPRASHLDSYNAWLFCLSMRNLQNKALESFNEWVQGWDNSEYLYTSFDLLFYPQLIPLFSF